MISKLVVHGKNRKDALRALRKALGEYEVVGPSTNIAFLQSIASHPSFIEGDVHTAFIPQHSNDLFAPQALASPEILAQAATYITARQLAMTEHQPISPWTTLPARRFGSDSSSFDIALVEPAGTDSDAVPRLTDTSVNIVSTVPQTSKRLYCDVNVDTAAGPTQSFDAASVTSTTLSDYACSQLSLLGEGRHWASIVSELKADAAETLHVFADGIATRLELPVPEWLQKLKGATDSAPGSAKAPMPCKVIKLMVEEGDKVEQGQAVCLMAQRYRFINADSFSCPFVQLVAVEAMKTELILRAPKVSIILKVQCKEGDLVTCTLFNHPVFCADM